MNTEQSKVCPYCAEQVKPRAKVCPFCKQWLSFWSLRNPAAFIISITLLAVFGLGWMVHDIHHRLDRGVDFSTYRDDITVMQSRMNFQTNEDTPEIDTVLVLTNKSDLAWQRVEVELRYFNDNGELIDARHDWSPGVMYPHQDSAWTVPVKPALALSDYASNSVCVRYATDARAYAY